MHSRRRLQRIRNPNRLDSGSRRSTNSAMSPWQDSTGRSWPFGCCYGETLGQKGWHGRPKPIWLNVRESLPVPQAGLSMPFTARDCCQSSSEAASPRGHRRTEYIRSERRHRYRTLVSTYNTTFPAISRGHPCLPSHKGTISVPFYWTLRVPRDAEIRKQ